MIIICLSGSHFTTDVVKTLLMIWSKGTGYCSNMFKCSSTSNMIIWTKHEYCKAHMCPYDRNSHKVHVATQPQPSWAGERNIFDALHFELWYTLQSFTFWYTLKQGYIMLWYAEKQSLNFRDKAQAHYLKALYRRISIADRT